MNKITVPKTHCLLAVKNNGAKYVFLYSGSSLMRYQITYCKAEDIDFIPENDTAFTYNRRYHKYFDISEKDKMQDFINGLACIYWNGGAGTIENKQGKDLICN